MRNLIASKGLGKGTGQTSKTDSIRTDAVMNIILSFGYMSPDSVLYYAEKLKIAGRESHFPPAEALGYANIGFALKQLDNRASALENSIKALKIAENYSNYRALSMVYDVLGIIYPVEDPKRLNYLFKAFRLKMGKKIIANLKFAAMVLFSDTKLTKYRLQQILRCDLPCDLTQIK